MHIIVTAELTVENSGQTGFSRYLMLPALNRCDNRPHLCGQNDTSPNAALARISIKKPVTSIHSYENESLDRVNQK